MEMDSKKRRYYEKEKEIKTNLKEDNRIFKNKIGKQRRNCWWN